MTTAAQKKAAKRARRPIYGTFERVAVLETGEERLALLASHPIDRRLLKERGYREGDEVRIEIKKARVVWQHRLIHKIGQLMVDNVHGWEQLNAHDAVKRLQRESGICCEEVEIDARPVIAAVLAIVQMVVGKRTFKKLAKLLPVIEKVPVRQAESLAFDEMEQDRFEQLFDGITEYMGKAYAHVMVDEVRAEFWEMAGRNRSAGMTAVAVLFARRDSIYKTLPDCDVFDIDRDARTFTGGLPIVAHPPCRAWGTLKHFAKPLPGEKELAPWAIEQVRQNGGVLEHPNASGLWAAVGAPCARKNERDRWGGWTIVIWQSWWGHRADKATRLYICGCDPSNMPPFEMRLGLSSHVVSPSNNIRKGHPMYRPQLRKPEREHTPPALAEWLVELARCCKPALERAA